MTIKTYVKTTSSQYPVMIGSHHLEEALQDTLKHFANDSIFLIIDQNVNHFHGDVIKEIIKGITRQVHLFEIPAGETSKSFDFYIQTHNFILQHGIRRNTPIIVVGGGVTGDLGGFVASTVLRGVPLIHIPTTLLAMVDSSIGGKTGINHHTGKNLIGTFYQPVAVICDTLFLDTLPHREWINGLSEILKYGAIQDHDIFISSEMFLSNDYNNLDTFELIKLIGKCVDIKASIVGKDEHESNIRAYLNFGHTFAHALEKACDYDKISHGEAVYLGMLAAMKLSEMVAGKRFDHNYLSKFRELYRYRITKDQLSSDDLLKYMSSDKKRTGANLKFVLLNHWQDPFISSVDHIDAVYEALKVIYHELELNKKLVNEKND